MKNSFPLICVMFVLRHVIAFLPSSVFLHQQSHRFKLLDTSNTGDNNVKQVVIAVEGQVQGPYYRTICKNEVVFNRKLSGYLKEKENNITEIVVQGTQPKLESFIRWCKRVLD